jgi:signal transduction histidine kinase
MKDNSNIVANETEKQVLLVHDAFWQALGDRDVEKRFSFCADTITFIGSALNEKAANREEYIAINKKGIQQYPDKFEMTILWKRITVADDLAVVETEVEWEMKFDGRIDKEMLRNSVVLKKTGAQWLIVHVHGSMPDYLLAGQNYMTNAETSKRNVELEQQVFQRTKELNKTIEILKSTQAQLIQSEKMASLGELTAGIAHEIQNPLNFVNNFSEVNTELIDEMKEEFKKGNTTEAVQLAEDIKQNNEKISFHGKRADSIVKGMLQHSRNSSGAKELTDINNLADECLRLSYHGFRAKDHSFNSKTETHFEEGLPDIQVAPQDIGRVLLNLITNSFYSVAQKRRLVGEGYEPMIDVATRNLGNAIEIRVRDNGNGVPQKVLDKIFQPFFTTKPTGEGTGLGLSMSYEIITKGHGGQLQVDTKEGEYAEFRITIPFKH